MKFTLPSPRELIFGVAVFLLAAVCAILAFLQYRWIGQVANAEQQRLHQELQRHLNFVRRDFNAQIAAASNALVPTISEVAQFGRDKSYVERYQRAGDSTQKSFSRVALAVPEHGEVDLLLFDSKRKDFRRTDWPLGWAKLRESLSGRLAGGPPTPEQYRPEGVIEFPRFSAPGLGEPEHKRPREQEWLILEFDRDYLRNVVLPPILQRYLTESARPQYSVIVSETSDPWQEVYRWGPRSEDKPDRPDASVTLFELDSAPFRGLRASRVARAAPDPARSTSSPSEAAEPQAGEMADSPPPGHGFWTLRVNHPAGTLESIVARARRRNLFLVAGLLSLLIATVVALVRFTQGTEKLAELQINFVSGISHELRTPLSVIRAAGFNLRTKFAHRPEQVERYGALIQEESEKLTSLVEQILRYGGVESGRILGARELVEIAALLEQSLPGTRHALADAGITLEQVVAPDLPLIRADKQSLTHAFRNLLENAVKHANREHTVIRITAARTAFRGTTAVRIGIQDNGPGIPKEERDKVFEPFFRGKHATDNQIHGTGLGLNLAKRIIEAHGGSLSLRSELGKGAEFVATIPAVWNHR